MVIMPDMLAYYTSIPISRLEQEVAQMVTALRPTVFEPHLSREEVMWQHIVRPTASIATEATYTSRTAPALATRYVPGASAGLPERLYYEDMPLHYHGQLIREAQDVVLSVDPSDFHI